MEMNVATSTTMPVDQDRLDRLFREQQDHFDTVVRHSSARERIKKLNKMKKWLFAHQEEIRNACQEDFKKPLLEVDNSEIFPLLTEIRHTSRNLEQWMRPKSVPAPMSLLGTRSHIRRDPKGVSLIISPWNYPFMLTLGPLISAIAAGNCVFIKPSEMTPHSNVVMRKMLAELFPEQEVAWCEGEVEMAQALLKMPFSHIFFTGSPRVGKLVMHAAADQLASVTLELGGKNPVIIDRTANIKDATEKIVWGKIFNVGQSCMAPDYVLVDQEKAGSFEIEVKTVLGKYLGNNAESIKNNPDFGRLINRKHFDRLSGWLDEALEQGASIIAGGERDRETCYLAPTILKIPSRDFAAEIFHEEIFGPILLVVEVPDLETALLEIRKRPRPLGLYIFSRSNKNIRHILDTTHSGTSGVNEVKLPFVHPDLPFGGQNNSGIGNAHGHSGFMAFTNERSVLRNRRGFTTAKQFYPPYKPGKLKMFQWVMKLF